MNKLLLATGCLWASISASAATIQSDVLTVFNAAGAIVGQVGVNEDGSLFGLNAAVFHFFPNPPADEDPGGVYYINDSSLANPARFGFATGLLESGGGRLSDIFGVVNIQGAFFLGFASDTELAPVSFPAPSTTLLETGAPVSATSYLSTALQTAGYTATFVSDAPEVPEPGTWSVVAVGLAVLSYGASKRSSRARHGA